MDERAQLWERRFQWPLVAAALLTVPVLVVEESPFGPPWSTIAAVLNWVTWAAFVAEFAVMMAVVPDRRKWMREHPVEVVVTFLTPPFLPATLQAFRVLRVLRVARIFGVHRLRRLLSLEGIRYATLLVLLVIVVGGTAFSAIEERGVNAWDGVWFATETVTTVGYGDIIPETSAGRVVAMLIMFVGIGFVALLTAFVADRFIHHSEGSDEAPGGDADVGPNELMAEMRKIGERLARVERELARDRAQPGD